MKGMLNNLYRRCISIVMLFLVKQHANQLRQPMKLKNGHVAETTKQVRKSRVAIQREKKRL
jgi:hypothetical protein